MTSHREHVQVLGGHIVRQPQADTAVALMHFGRPLLSAQCLEAVGYCIDAPEWLPAGGMVSRHKWTLGAQRWVCR